MARLYLDENIDTSLCSLLIEYGHDVITVQDANNTGDSDEAIIGYAIENSRAVVTHNRRHFMRLHKAHKEIHCGIIICTNDPDLASLALHIHEALNANEPIDKKLIRITRANP